jgi:hypothetical protein
LNPLADLMLLPMETGSWSRVWRQGSEPPVASRAAAQTGLSPDVLKGMLPIVAALVMGAMARQASPASGGRFTPASTGGMGGGLRGMLGATLDQTATDQWWTM